MFVFACEDEDEDEMRDCLRTLEHACAQLGFSEVEPELEPAPASLLLRGMRRAECSVLVLELARSEPVKQARKRPGGLVGRRHRPPGGDGRAA